MSFFKNKIIIITLLTIFVISSCFLIFGGNDCKKLLNQVKKDDPDDLVEWITIDNDREKKWNECKDYIFSNME